MINNILWDLDGTLFDTYPAITYAISKSLSEMGLSIALNMIDGLARQSIDQCMQTLAHRFKLDPDLLRSRFAESYRTVDPANQLPFPGVREVCEMIHAHGGLNVIITHRSVRSTQRLLDTHGMASYFDDIFSVEQGYSRKPDPAMALAALKKHNLNSAKSLFVGDREIDVQSGRAAGVRTCLFGGVALTTPADFQIEHYGQLLKMLKHENLSN
jgi:HAD superfamily hydrolase (TIGR01509 family)